mmetsp:Transcript_8862/g.20151  ORF Transcript_8862/g.20151 Transcript_8862/m.20151 type:complete len:216 (-) Transcript_8862:79-726(-)
MPFSCCFDKSIICNHGKSINVFPCSRDSARMSFTAYSTKCVFAGHAVASTPCDTVTKRFNSSLVMCPRVMSFPKLCCTRSLSAFVPNDTNTIGVVMRRNPPTVYAPKSAVAVDAIDADVALPPPAYACPNLGNALADAAPPRAPPRAPRPRANPSAKGTSTFPAALNIVIAAHAIAIVLNTNAIVNRSRRWSCALDAIAASAARARRAPCAKASM